MSEEKIKRPPAQKGPRLLQIPLVRILGLAILIVLLIVATTAVLGGVSKKETKKSAPDNCIYPVDTEEILDMRDYADGLAVLKTGSLCYIDDVGIEIAAHEHAYGTPVLRTAGRYALLFDRGGTALRLEKDAKITEELPFESALTNAEICKNGVYGYVLNASEGYQSHFYVFNEKGEKLFEWGSASDYVTLLKLNENGKKAALVSFVTENGEYSSKVISFDFNASEPLFSVELKKTTVFAVKYQSGGAIAVFADNGVYTISKNGEIETVRSYSTSEINSAAVTDAGLSGLSLNLYGNEHTGEISVYDRHMKLKATYSCGSRVTGLAADKQHVAVASGNRLQILSKNRTVRSILLDESCVKCVLKKTAVYILTVGGVRSYDLVGGDTTDAFAVINEQ